MPSHSDPEGRVPSVHGNGRAAGGIPQPGTVLAGRYVVENVLGSGGMGVVLAARHIHLGQRVAIKFMRGEAATDPNAVGRFLREARAVVALTSEHVAKVLDFGTLEAGEPYTVMEYLSGSDLAHVLRQKGPMAVSDAVGVVLQACEAMAEAHALGIVHRDLKPANLFVTKRMDGTPLVKVLDFGISKMSAPNSPGSNESLTSSGLVMGSPGYMSPEQVRNAKSVDARSDIWAIGVILYELLTGASPFAGETVGEVFARIVTETPASLGQLRAEVPEGLARAVAQCLERDLRRRVQSVGALASMLLPFASAEARLSVDRIHRVSVGLAAPVQRGADTLAVSQMQSALLGETETGPAWLKSTGSAKVDPPVRHRRLVAAVAMASVIAVVGGASVYALRSRAPQRPSASASEPLAPSSASAGDDQPVETLPV
ncbi:MAG: serine/threonine protein kinase, partial [Myxococcota bacterium]|nr:serine/threonine protein kinase [Myxococcota bacterium]